MHRYEGYCPVTADVTAYWRPALKNCPSKHYYPAANRALPAVIFGMIGQVGELNGQRVALPRNLERVHPKDAGEKGLWREVFQEVKKTPAATPPDETIVWQENGQTIRAEIWHNLILNKTLPDPQASTFDVYVIHDPDFETPWVLATPVKLQAPSVRAIYRDRWPVEQIPLSAKHMVGAHRQFVHAPESVQRLPELALLAGSILTFLAATAPATPTGLWDHQPKRTPGRLRRSLIGKPFPKDYQFSGQLRKKASATAHLPKGSLAHRRKSLFLCPSWGSEAGSWLNC